jgi:predicted GNAT family N-acyltransferase
MDNALRFEVFNAKIHNRKEFSCTEPSLTRFIQEQARKEQESRTCNVFVLTNGTTIAGYYTLSNTTIQLEGLPGNQSKNLPKYPNIPATLLGRLAVNQTFAGQGYGKDLLIDALKRAYLVSSEVASWAIVVDALHEEAARFYIKFGFVPFESQPLRLFLPMATVGQLF